jgi:hypothetical protein
MPYLSHSIWLSETNIKKSLGLSEESPACRLEASIELATSFWPSQLQSCVYWRAAVTVLSGFFSLLHAPDVTAPVPVRAPIPVKWTHQLPRYIPFLECSRKVYLTGIGSLTSMGVLARIGAITLHIDFPVTSGFYETMNDEKTPWRIGAYYLVSYPLGTN